MKRFFAAFAALFMLTATGCASGRIQERSYLRAAAIMENGEKSAAFSLFSEDAPVTSQGNGPDSAKKNAELKNGKSIFTGYTELIIVDGKNCPVLLEHMLNEWKVSPSCTVVYSSCGDRLISELGAEKLIGMAKQAVRQGIAPECDLITVLGSLCTENRAEIAELRTDGTAGSHIIYRDISSDDEQLRTRHQDGNTDSHNSSRS